MNVRLYVGDLELGIVSREAYDIITESVSRENVSVVPIELTDGQNTRAVVWSVGVLIVANDYETAKASKVWELVRPRPQGGRIGLANAPHA